ncbi:polysaccharide deacetylase family protein [Desulfovibrio ferrophilus]|uniref:Polysaccharide deacetylase n=1 Tax=Desulfovibrio ferrophilus TaxID=241368 RepID=A0A2Z6AWR3_9BACT|nr:polysaccharide deacetylase family protein [Desulfovibrio ferrophilus]BBD07692.1 Polysaccharide deacetylase [Desulfovibrio ferrophilus]
MNWGKLLGKTSVPVLCYHNLGGNGVPRESFVSQMRWLKDNGVCTLNQSELRRFLEGETLTSPSVMITFDDGFRDLYTFARPILKDLGLTATVFIINDRMRPNSEIGFDREILAHQAHLDFLLTQNRSAWLSLQELKELLEEGVFELGSHSFSHRMKPTCAPELVELPTHWAYALQSGQDGPYSELKPELAHPLWLANEQRQETTQEMISRVQNNLEESRRELEAQCERPVTAFAWPWGETHPAAEQAVEKAGLDLRFTLKRGAVDHKTPPGSIPRLEVRRHKGLGWFASRVALYSRPWTATLYSGARI